VPLNCSCGVLTKAVAEERERMRNLGRIVIIGISIILTFSLGVNLGLMGSFRQMIGNLSLSDSININTSSEKKSFSSSSSFSSSISLSQSNITRKELSIMTWNVWFEDVEYEKRMNGIILTILEKRPDVACFQEVLPEFVKMISFQTELMRIYQVSPFESSSYDLLTIVKKEYHPEFQSIPFPSRMGRRLLKTILNVKNYQIVVGNVHLESLAFHPTRVDQLGICAEQLRKYSTAFLVGDFNFCSERNFVETPGQPLENDALTSIFPDYDDLWKSEKVTRVIDGVGNKKTSIDIATGFTFNSAANHMIGKEEMMRYDRVLAKLGNSSNLLLHSHDLSGKDFLPVDITLLGTAPIDPHLVVQIRGWPVTGLWASDHFGLLAKVLFPIEDLD
jgi:endonuclease/exonuclease/phosphatase family metal-dependent hydrolase